MNNQYAPEIEILPILAATLLGINAIDVGANRGEFTQALRLAGFEVNSFEPLPILAGQLRQRFAQDDKVKIHQVACSETDGFADLIEYTVSDPQNDSTLFSALNPHPTGGQLEYSTKIRVETCRLNTFLDFQDSKRVALLKIDTEGSDLSVLRGGSQIDAEAILVEFWDEQFIFNGGQVPNRLSDYLQLIDKTKFPYNFLFWRDGYNLHSGTIFNALQSPVGSWGNLLFLSSETAFEAVKNFVSLRYGAENMAEGKLPVEPLDPSPSLPEQQILNENGDNHNDETD